MQSRRQLLAEVALVTVTALVGVAFVEQLPAEVAIHFGSEGQPDDYASESVALATIPAVQAGMVALFAVLPRVDPLGENLRQFERAYDGFVLVLLGFLGYVHALVVVWSAGYGASVTLALVPAMAAFYYTLGTLVQDAERNWFVGFRTPWTLSNEEVWADTHTVAGKLMRVAAVLTLGALALPGYAIAFLAGPVVAVALFATAYSYWDYRRIEVSTS
jgi:uncharacterized membrane protein